MNWTWEPGLGLGPLRFGKPLPEGGADLGVEDLGWGDDGTGWESFGLQGGALTAHLEAGNLVALECWQHIEYQGRNLVGLDMEQLQRIFGESLQTGATVGEATGFEVSDLGLSLWIEAGRVESASIQGLK